MIRRNVEFVFKGKLLHKNPLTRNDCYIDHDRCSGEATITASARFPLATCVHERSALSSKRTRLCHPLDKLVTLLYIFDASFSCEDVAVPLRINETDHSPEERINYRK